MKKKIVVFTGAGVSQESGLPTFRGEGGIWETIDAEKVADYRSWYCGRRSDCNERRQAVLDFFNPIRRMILNGDPNEAHRLIAGLETTHEVTVITQNGDDFHERAGSSKVIHLHGEALKNTSTLRPYIPIEIDPSNPDIKIGDKASDGSQIRPYVVFFNENLQYGILRQAIQAIREADIMIIIGCSLKVFPAARLVEDVREEASVIVIDPCESPLPIKHMYAHLRLPASKGMRVISETIMQKESE